VPAACFAPWSVAGWPCGAGGSAIDRLLARDRNDRGAPSFRLPPRAAVMSLGDGTRALPSLGLARRKGDRVRRFGTTIVTVEPDRLTLAWGARCRRPRAHFQLHRGNSSRRRIPFVPVRTRLTGPEAVRTSRSPGSRSMQPPLGSCRPSASSRECRSSKAINLVTRREAGDEAIGGERRRGATCSSCRGAGARSSAPGSPRGPPRRQMHAAEAT